jgi:MYXO-CTERM domain-containing protein
MRFCFAGALSVVALTFVSSDARACQLRNLLTPYTDHLQREDDASLPANGVVADVRCFADGIPATRDERLSALFGIHLRRFASEPAVGATFASPICPGRLLRIASTADLVAPSQVVVDRVRTVLVRNPDLGREANCPELDMLEVTMAARDDVATVAQLGLLAFIGADTAAVDSATTPSMVLSPDVVGDRLVVRAWLGLNGLRAGNESFDRPGPMCFSFAAFDRAANIGPRSVTRCLNTTDPNDPSVEFVQGSAGCSVHASTGVGDKGAAPWLAMIALIGAGTTRRRAKRIAATRHHRLTR